MIISASLARRSSWQLLLSGSEVAGGELRMRKRDQGAPAMLKCHNRTMRMHTLISTTRSSTLASSRLPGRKLTALTVCSFQGNVKNPICSHFKPSSPNIAKGFGVHKMVLLILIVSLKYHILAVEF